ncbi:LysR substrate-binding domain-containing protein [Thorsellia kenyensis]|uniref:LysR substrate-binding domain-containing protein n=1 Tax=Thorsellia kenyensis TaxID=1549888 RepID=A0ABV6CD44_9GAMM
MELLKANTDDYMILLAVHDFNGFSAAAKHLNYPVSRITRSIASLEKNYGVSLFTRTTRKMTPTNECHFFVERIRPHIEELIKAEHSLMRLNQTPQGVLRVDAVNSFILHQLLPIVDIFQEKYPAIQLALISNDNIIDLIEQKTDIAIRIGPLQDSNLHATFLGKSTLKIVASPTYLATSGTPFTVAELLTHRFIGFSQPSKFNQWPLSIKYIERLTPDQRDLLGGHFIKISPIISASSGETILGLCLKGHGIALLSNFTVKSFIESGQLIEIMPGLISSDHPRNLVNAVYYKNQSLSAKFTVFIDFLKEHLTL